MVDKIQRYPTGLVGSLAIVGGQGPKQLGETLIPTMDATDFYFVRDMSISIATVAGIAVADVGPQIVIPPLEFWRLWGLSTSVGPSAAAAVVAVSHFIQNPPFGANLYHIVFPSPPSVVVAAGQTRVDFGGMLPSGPIILPPGTILQSATQLPPGGATSLTLTIRALYQRLQA